MGPSLHYDFGELVKNYKYSGNAVEQKNEATHYGLGIFAKSTMSSGSSSSDLEAITKLMTFGLTAGISFSSLRLWPGFNIADSLTVDGYSLSDSTANDNYEGKSIKIGLGYKVLPSFSLNLEYLMHSYDTLTLNTSSSSYTYKLPTDDLPSVTDAEIVKINSFKVSMSYLF